MATRAAAAKIGYEKVRYQSLVFLSDTAYLEAQLNSSIFRLLQRYLKLFGQVQRRCEGRCVRVEVWLLGQRSELFD